jgi:uncharacterized protein
MLAERIGSAQLAEMSAQGASLAATLRRTDLPRLAEILAQGSEDRDRPLAVEIELRNGPERLPIVRIRVRGELALVCQRCFGPVVWPLDVDVMLTAVPSETAADVLADPFDSVVLDAEGALPLRATVEDEILAALPLAPVHADRAACGVGGADGEPAKRVHRPFAGLDALLGGRERRDDGQ